MGKAQWLFYILLALPIFLFNIYILSDLSNVRAENHQLSSELANLSHQQPILHANLAKLEAEKQQLHHDLKNLTQTRQDLLISHETKKAEIDMQKYISGELRATIGKLESKTQDKENELEETKLELKNIQHQVKSQHTTLESLRNHLQSILDTTVKTQEETLHEQTVQIQQLEVEKSELLEEFRNVQTRDSEVMKKAQKQIEEEQEQLERSKVQVEEYKVQQTVLEQVIQTSIAYKDAPTPNLKIKWLGECGCTGMHLEALNLIYPLWRKGLNIRLNKCDNPCDFKIDSQLELMLDEMKKVADFKEEDADIVISHYAPSGVCPLNHSPAGPYCISRGMFESDSLPPDAVKRCNKAVIREIWVPSEFNRDSFIRAGVDRKKFFVMHESINPMLWSRYGSLASLGYGVKIPTSGPHQYMGLKPNKFNFFSVFKFEVRKNWKGLVRAFIQEFQGNENVTLFLKTHKAWEGDPIPALSTFINSKEFDNIPQMPNIEVIDWFIPSDDMPFVYSMMDCFVFPTHGEGWGLPVMEAMAMELPVIVTAWGGTTEFAAPPHSILFSTSPPSRSSSTTAADSSLPDRFLFQDRLLSPEDVSIEGEYSSGYGIKVDKMDIAWNKDNGYWAVPSEVHLRKLMRYVVEHPEEAKKKGKRGRQEVLLKYTQEAVALQYLKRFEQIQDKILQEKEKLALEAKVREAQKEIEIKLREAQDEKKTHENELLEKSEETKTLREEGKALREETESLREERETLRRQWAQHENEAHKPSIISNGIPEVNVGRTDIEEEIVTSEPQELQQQQSQQSQETLTKTEIALSTPPREHNTQPKEDNVGLG